MPDHNQPAVPQPAVPDPDRPSPVTVLVIPATAPPYTTTVTPDLRTLQQLVGGQIEAVYRPGWHAYLHEEGKLVGLPLNPLATEILFGVDEDGVALPAPSDLVAGDVVLLGDGPADGEADVPGAVIARVLARANPRRRGTPVDLLAALPLVLGRRPTDALVVLGLADGQFDSVGVAPLLLLTDQAALTKAVLAVLRPGIDGCVIAVIGGAADPQPIPHQQLAIDARAVLSVLGADVAAAIWTPLLSPGASWLSYDTGAGGSMPDPGRDRSAVVRRMLSGRLGLPSTDELRRELEPDDDVPTLHPARPQDAGPVGAGPAPDAALVISRALTAAAEGAFDLSDQQLLGELVHSLQDPLTRDQALHLSAGAPPEAAERLWTLLTRAVPGPYRSAPAVLLAACMLMNGDARRCRTALALAQDTQSRAGAESEPQAADGLVRLVRHSLDRGLPPQALRDIARRVPTVTDPGPFRDS